MPPGDDAITTNTTRVIPIRVGNISRIRRTR